MITAVIIDDESAAIEMMEWLLKTYVPEVQTIGAFASGAEAMKGLKELKPDLVFLDIEMPGMNGFDLLEALAPLQFGVIFTTAYDQFAAKAFRFSAIDYLLKPVDPDELKQAVSRFQQTRRSINADQLEILLENLSPKRREVSRIALSTGEGLVFVKTEDILYCAADSNYTKVHMADGRKITVAKTLKELDETLAGQEFARVHASFLVNINHIQKYVKGDGGYIVMPDGAEIGISRSKREEFFQLFSRF
ncbi:MAG: response regulator transcription factor [Bacteroidetes bacterium]|nr:response regulator transcription factor [Bacteroidota bacterium]